MPKGKENAYECQSCKGIICTIDIDEGVTPFIIECLATKCGGEMHSSFYPTQPKPPEMPDAAYEWYKPTDLSKYSPAMQDHIKMGGLVIREKASGKDV